MAAPAKALSARDKEELKEKLALLQREYRKTVSRLQRAERTEKVKSYVKKTVAEQNHLLLQAAAKEDPAGSASQVALEASASNPPGSSETNATKTPSVTFNLEPEVFCQEGHLPKNTGLACTDGEREQILGGPLQPVPGEKRNRLSRSRRKGRPTVASKEMREDARDGDQPGNEGASLESSQSPVFMGQGSSFEMDRSVPRMPPAMAVMRGSGTAGPVTPQQEGLQGARGGNIPPRVLGPPHGHLSEESQGLSSEGIFATSEDSAVKDTALPANVENVLKEKDGGREGEGDPGETAPREGGSETCQERSPFGKLQRSGRGARESPALEPGRTGSGGEAEAGPPLLEAVSPATPTNSLLDSCTVVEGLLFPVEYYVRTTRRMSRCQREPNLAAVIQSQLGKRRRSPRASPKDRVASPTPATQGLPASGSLFPPPDAGQEKGSGSPLASKESPGPGEGLPQSGAVTQRSRRARWKGRRRPRRGALGGNHSLALSEVCRPEPQEQAGNLGLAGVEPDQSGSVSSHQSRRGSQSCAGAPDPALLGCLRLPGTLKWLPSDLALQEFHLPAEEFGLLQSEKVKASAVKAAEVVGAGESVECLQGPDLAELQAAEESPGDVLLSPEDEPPELSPPLQGLHTSKLLLSPTNVVPEGGSSQLETQLPTPLFPVVGATPATQDCCDAPGQARADSPQEPSAGAVGTPTCGTEEERYPVGMSCPEGGGGASWEPGEATVSVDARQKLPSESREHCGASASQQEIAEDLAQGLKRCQEEGNLQMTSKLKNSAGSCCVDMSAVWWEGADFTALCIVTACETSVALWRPLDSGCWETIHTWRFAEVPVFQIVPLPGAHSLVCTALGGLEIAEIRLLFHSLGDGCLKQPLVKAGNIKAVLGLSGRRLVSSCGPAVEVLSFPDAGGGCVRQALSPPEETTLAFAAVDGMAEALVGLNAANCVVLWNLRTGQLLCQMPLGYAYPASVCHQAYSDSGLLFVVLSHPRAKESQSCGSPAFQVVAFNPKTARSAQVMIVSLPPGLQGRYLEGDVRDTSAAAVLTSGAVAVWDLLGGECTALLPPSAEGSWSLVRWSVTEKCLLAGQADGSVCIYSYAARPCSAPETVQRDGQHLWASGVPEKGELSHRDFSGSLPFWPRTG
uniref:partner and localizer of BRCA2 n=1 Tax=Euleptes europaea TaxID=460621 RepID=UPI002540DAF9|nr:partner and localizer of BRCA2 [Euleptes europaea]